MKTTEINESMKLRFMLLRENGYEVERAQKCLNFIHGGIEEAPAPGKAGELADGVYLIDIDGKPVLFTGQALIGTEKSRYNRVGVKLGSKFLAIAMYDTCEDETTLTEEKGGTRFITDFHEAVADWNGEANTEDMRNILSDAALVEDGKHIPALGELYFILLHIREINAALKAIDGEPMKGWYWSSTQSSAGSAWILYLYDGGAYRSTRATTKGRVRAVSAFLPLNR